MSEIEIDKKILLRNTEGENLEPYITTDSTLSTESNNPVQNNTVTTELNGCLRFNVQGLSPVEASSPSNHANLSNLDYEHSGHTGFVSSAEMSQVYTQLTEIEQALSQL